MMMRLEGIVLDTCYTGKAFAGLIHRAQEGTCGPEDNVLLSILVVQTDCLHRIGNR